VARGGGWALGCRHGGVAWHARLAGWGGMAPCARQRAASPQVPARRSGPRAMLQAGAWLACAGDAGVRLEMRAGPIRIEDVVVLVQCDSFSKVLDGILVISSCEGPVATLLGLLHKGRSIVAGGGTFRRLCAAPRIFRTGATIGRGGRLCRLCGCVDWGIFSTHSALKTLHCGCGGSISSFEGAGTFERSQSLVGFSKTFERCSASTVTLSPIRFGDYALVRIFQSRIKISELRMGGASIAE
jgi:hypothetical protein